MQEKAQLRSSSDQQAASPSTVGGLLAELDNIIVMVDKETSNLINRIDGILAPEKPVGQVKDDVKEPVVSPLANVLRRMTNNLKFTLEAIQDVNSRIEL